MNYIIHHGTDGTEGTIIGYAEDMNTALSEVERLLDWEKIPGLIRREDEVIYNFIRNDKSEWIRIRRFNTCSVRDMARLSGIIKPHSDYSLFV